MGGINFSGIAALANEGGQIAQAPLNEYGETQRINALQAQTQGQQLQNEVLKNQIADQNTLRGLMPQYVTKDDSGKPTGFDWNGLLTAAQGKVMPETLFKLQQQQGQMRQSMATATKDELANQATINNEMYQRSESIKGISDPTQRQQQYLDTRLWAQQHGLNVTGWPAQAPDNDHLTAMEAEFGMHAQALKDQQTQAETAKASGEAAAAQAAVGQRQAEARAAKFKEVNGVLYDISGVTPKPAIGQTATDVDWKALIQGVTSGNAPLAARLQSEVDFYRGQGNIKAAQDAITKAGEEQGSIEHETNPSVVRTKEQLAYQEAQARQQAAQGDPAVAGKMLADGSLTLTDLKTRGSTPQFIEQATLAAQKQNPTYNPADEVIAESVAKSPVANQFFGSANSLISKGGTLDQLEDEAKKIPGHKFPVLNKIEDWEELARGKGPLAGYAATALGAADDYAKVMGGGQGSDTSRMQALSVFAKAASPEQRADAISGVRNSVQSQRDSRIGNNQFLKRAYGVETSKGTNSGGGGLSVTAPNGKTYNFKDQASADAFRKAAGL